jgi:hypothetical protein
MSEDEDNSQSQPADGPPPALPKPVTVEEFDAIDFEGGLKNCENVDPHCLVSKFMGLAREAEERQDQICTRVYGLLYQVCSIHLRIEDRAEPWVPMFSGPGGRTAIPSDFKGEQSAAFLAILERIKNPGLQARLADIVWSNDRKASRAAAIGVSAYHQCAEGLLNGKYKPYLNESRASFETLKYLRRGFAIAQEITKKDSKGRPQIPNDLTASALKLYRIAHDAHEFVVFLDAAGLALYYGLLDKATVAGDCEEIANTKTEQFIMPIKNLWDLAARLYSALGDKNAEQRCRFGSVEQTRAMRKQVHGASAEAHWVQQAVLELRHIKGHDELEDQLLLELRRLQRASIKEMKPFSIDLDVRELRNRVEGTFEKYELAEALRELGLLVRSRSVKDLRQEALDLANEYPIQGIMGIAHIDDEGKPIAHSPSAEMKGEQSENWYRSHILNSEDIRRQRSIAGIIEPARIIIQARFMIEERHLEPIIMRSPFIPPSQAPIITLGLARYFQGDFISAAHLLILQLEPCLRHILKLNGHDPVHQRDDGTEEDYDLNAMLKNMKTELENIFGADWVYEIDLLFAGRPGPSLRNDLAHGQISSYACFHHNVLYGCWMMYRLCMVFLLEHWNKIAPELKALE